MTGRSHLWKGFLAALVASLLAVPAASAATGDLTPLGAMTDVGLGGARGVAVSPDGKNVYVASQTADALVLYTRAANGTLTYGGCIKDTGAAVGCATSTEGLNGAHFVAVSPDGKSVYVSGGDDGAVALFDRDTGNGTLVAAGCWRDTASPASCAVANVADGLRGSEGIAVSPDDKNLYVASQTDSTVVTFSRTPGATALSSPSCLENSGSPANCTTNTSAMLFPRELTVAPDGKGVYVAAANSGIVAFLRNTSTGALSGAGTATGANLPVGVTVSPDNAFVYAGVVNGRMVRTYSRDTVTAALTVGDCAKDPSNAGDTCSTIAEGLNGAEGVVVSHDGANVYAASLFDNAVVTLSRSGGALGAVNCFRDNPGGSGCGSADGLLQSRGIAISPDDRSVYVAGQGDSAVSMFAREVPAGSPGPGPGPPTGNPTPPDTPHHQTFRPECFNATTLLVTCADPNGRPGVCGPSGTIFPQCSMPADLPTVCGPGGTILQACGPGNNYVAACGGTGTVLPVCTGSASPILVCGGSGTALPQCSLPPSVTGQLFPDGTGEVDVTVGCNAANRPLARGARNPPTNCEVDAVVADFKRTRVNTLKSQAQGDAYFNIDNNLDFSNQTVVQYNETLRHDIAVYIARSNRIVDTAFSDAEAGRPFRSATAVFQLTNLGLTPAYVGRYPLTAQFERFAGEWVARVATAVNDYKVFLDYRRSRRRLALPSASASALVRPFVRKHVSVRRGARTRIRIRLSRAVVSQLRRGVTRRKAVAVRLIVTYRTRPRPVIRMIDFSLRVPTPRTRRGG
jgi:DNA-binding beta-propeller fold protein YncE